MSRIIRVFTDRSPTTVGDEVVLSESESNHLSRVLRLQSGDSLELLDGRGGCFPAECLELSHSSVRVRIMELHYSSAAVPSIRMAIAMGKANKLDDLIRPLTELGVAVITPLLSDRTEGSIASSKLRDKKERWKKIAQDACKQSGNLWMPKLDSPIRFASLVSEPKQDQDYWMGSLLPDSSPLFLRGNAKRISILVGPEGGWSEQEEQIARISGFKFFTLGPHVLRMETAAVSALAVARQNLLC